MSGDYNNIFSPDYWSAAAKAQRDEERRNSAHSLTQQQDKSNNDFWGGIGGMIGDAGKAVGNWAVGESRLDQRSGHPQQANMMPDRMPFGNGNGWPAGQLAGNFGGGGGGNVDDMRDNAMAGRAGSGPNSEQPAPMSDTDRILARLGERFTYDGAHDAGNQQNMSALDALLKSKMDGIHGLEAQTQGNFDKSSANIKAMHGAFQKDVLGQAPAIQARGKAAAGDISGIFNKTIGDNKAALAQENATKAEMLQRLGIAPAANAPDLVGAEYAHGNNVAQTNRDSRLAESATNTQTDLSRNTGLANAIGNDGLARGTQLNMRLQEVLGGLKSKEADYQGDYQKSRMDINNQGEDRAYQRWLQDRQFDMGTFNSINSHEEAMANAAAKAANQSPNSSSDISGLMASTSPGIRQAVIDASSKFDIANEPQKVMAWIGQNHKDLNADEVFNFVTNYAKVKGGKYAPTG